MWPLGLGEPNGHLGEAEGDYTQMIVQTMCVYVTIRQGLVWWSSSQGTLAASRSWNKQGKDSLLERVKGVQRCQHLDFRSEKLILDF